MKALAYVRISSDREGTQLGIERQEKSCRQVAKRLGWTIGQLFADNDRGASTISSKPRPAYAAMLEELRAGRAGAVVSYSTSRLSRRPREWEDLIDLAQGPRFVDFGFEVSPRYDFNTADGRLHARIAADIDAAEAERIAERVQAEVRQRAEQGRYHGGHRVFGIGTFVREVPKIDRRTGEERVDDDGNPVLRPVYDQKQLVKAEVAILQRMSDAVLKGRSLASIARELNGQGIRTVTGIEWSGYLVRSALLNPRVAGIRPLRVFVREEKVWETITYTAPNPPILPREVWDEIVARLSAPNRRKGTTNRRMHPGSGVFTCGRCEGQPVRTFYDMTGQGDRRRPARSYKCPRCNRRWRAQRVDEFVAEVVAQRLRRPDVRGLLAVPAVPVDTSLLRARESALLGKRKSLAKLLVDDVLTDAEVRETAAEIDAEIEKIRSALSEATAPDPAAEVLDAPDPASEWQRLLSEDVERAVIVLRSLVEVSLGQPPRGLAKVPLSSFIHVRWLRPAAPIAA
jgi:DNA invertase Pin-like site-specific DNA recombinase/DNA-directed RNA polymerase subunit M/transcription elongation factor TFIIS